MNCLFIYNPVSGKGKIAKIEGKIVQTLGRAFEQVDVYATKGPGEMTRVVAERAGGYGAIVFAGGDGTFNEVLQGVCESGADPVLGYIPVSYTHLHAEVPQMLTWFARYSRLSE